MTSEEVNRFELDQAREEDWTLDAQGMLENKDSSVRALIDELNFF